MATEDEVVEIIEAVAVAEVNDGRGITLGVIEETMTEIEKHPKEAEISVERYGDPEHRREHFRKALDATLLDVLDEGAKKLHEKVLPDSEQPLDHLRGVYRDHEAGEPLNLDLTIAEFLKEKPVTHHFAVDLVLAIQINTRWRIAPEKEMTPKAILVLAGLSAEEYSLYFPADSKEPLPPDTPVKLHRGQRFEAQRDGKYG